MENKNSFCFQCRKRRRQDWEVGGWMSGRTRRKVEQPIRILLHCIDFCFESIINVKQSLEQYLLMQNIIRGKICQILTQLKRDSWNGQTWSFQFFSRGIQRDGCCQKEKNGVKIPEVSKLLTWENNLKDRHYQDMLTAWILFTLSCHSSLSANLLDSILHPCWDDKCKSLLFSQYWWVHV